MSLIQAGLIQAGSAQQQLILVSSLSAKIVNMPGYNQFKIQLGPDLTLKIS
jgi:hypothetical protein